MEGLSRIRGEVNNMWKDYCASYIKNNRASSLSIMVAAFISTFFLSFLCTLFYNAWISEIDMITLEEGDWQGRIVGDIDEADINTIQDFPNVKRVLVNEDLSQGKKIVVDIYFNNMRTIYQDLPQIINKLGLEADAASYHSLLLSRYLIHDPSDKEPPLLLSFYLGVLFIVSFSLVLIIRNSFAVSMGARIHQFGIFSSIGATPKQILACLLQEAAILCVVPILLGYLLGIFACVGALEGANYIAKDIAGRYEGTFCYHPLISVITILASVLTVFFSAWLPARKISKLTPLEAILGTNKSMLKRKRNPRILSRMFGMEGELAANALKAQKKALRTSSLSLTLSFLGFTLMMCVLTLMDISTKHTYFERYQDAWDVMVTVKDTKIEEFDYTDKLRGLEGVRDIIVYQKAKSIISVSEDWISDDLVKLGGLEKVAGKSVTKSDGSWLIEAPIVIMDDEAFKEYCKEIGIQPKLEGTIILNEIWDSINSVFRYRKYIPFVKENRATINLKNTEKNQEADKIPVLGFTQQVPVLREEYSDYSLVQFISQSLWEKISGQIEGAEADTYIRILSREGVTLEELNYLEDNIAQLIGTAYEIESDNRIQNKITNDKIFKAYKLVFGSLCFLLAVIGIANVFSYTLGFIYQRKREFAQYMSVGLTPFGMRKIFIIEALVIAGRPLLITLLLTGIFEVFAIKASYLNPMEVLTKLPILPILLFSLVIIGFVALAYYIGGKRLLQCNLNEALQNDTLR